MVPIVPDPPLKDRTGHKSSQMIERYRSAARSAAELNLGPLAPLDQAIPEFALAENASSIASERDRWTYEPVPELPQIDSETSALCTRRDLNSHGSHRRNLNPVRLPFRHSC